MNLGWHIGSPLGFPVTLGPGFALLLMMVLVTSGGWLGVAITLVAFASVLAHELGHAVVARWLGVQVGGIRLGFFGGAAQLLTLPRTARHEIAIAAAGPAVSLMLAGAGFGVGAAIDSPLLTTFGWINAIIAAFNLLPAFPMDGGRILRAALTRWVSYVRATDLAVTVARAFAVVMVVVGLAWGPWTLALLAPMLWMMGSYERALARMVGPSFGRDAHGYRAVPPSAFSGFGRQRIIVIDDHGRGQDPRS